MQPIKPTRKERRYARHREEILQAALTLFSENGFHNVTMQQIAQAAEFSVGTLYSFFVNKEDLYQALIRETAEAFHDEIMAVLSQKDDELALIRRANAKKVELFLSNSAIIRLYLQETTGAGFSLRANMTQAIRVQYDDLLKMISGLFARGIQKGVFVAGDPTLYAAALDGMTNAMVLAIMEDPQRQVMDIETVCSLFFNGILNRPGGRDA